MKRLTVFCGSNHGARPEYTTAAREMGTLLAHEGITLVYGGGSVGLMGELADAVLAGGGEVIGVIPRALWEREVGHRGLTELRIVESMHERKAMMADLSDAFVALPGGLGTFEEIFEIWTWAQLGIHTKPLGFLDVAGYYTPLLAFLDRAVEERFFPAQFREIAAVESEPVALLQRLRAYEPPTVGRWMNGAKR